MKCLRLALKSGFRTLAAVAAIVGAISLFWWVAAGFSPARAVANEANAGCAKSKQ
jgi:hypothetical protein